MKRKEIKTFQKAYNKSNTKGRVEMVTSLWHSWVCEFQRTEKKSPKEVLGLNQRQNIWWREISEKLYPIRIEKQNGQEVYYYLTEYSFAEFLVQQVEQISAGIYPKEAMDSILRSMNLDPRLVREQGEDLMEVEFMEVNK